MHIRTLDDCIHICSSFSGRIVGIGVTAFMRIIPAFFFKEKFSIICYKDSMDVDLLSTYTNIFCLQRQQQGRTITKLNTSSILEHPLTQSYLKHFSGAYLFVYKNSTGIQHIANQIGCFVLNNPPQIRDLFENKQYFRTLLEKIHISPIPGENMPLPAFIKTDYQYFKNKYGSRLVIQLPDITTGGGKGTIFINNKHEFDDFLHIIKGGTYKNTIIHSINITRFITGISCSIIGCATKYGTFSSSIQTQLIDIPEVINLKKGSGLFCGHDRSYQHFSDTIQQQASKIVQQLGEYMYTQGYKGIFGLDLIVDTNENHVYVVECNSRYTGAFPMISFLDIQQGIPPMDVFHILEHLNIPYKVDFSHLDAQYKYKKEGSHIILSNKKEHEVICKKNLIPGVYTYANNTLLYQRPGIGYQDLKNKHEFIIIDGNPRIGENIKAYNELSRFCHLLFPKKISLAPNKLTNRTKNIIQHIYDTFIG